MSGSGDYISRNAAIEAMYKDAEANPNHTFWTSQFEALKSIPAADVRPVVKSKWSDNHVSFYRGCPECGAFVRANLDEVFLRDFPSAVGKLNFCPNCGADMRGEQDV